MNTFSEVVIILKKRETKEIKVTKEAASSRGQGTQWSAFRL